MHLARLRGRTAAPGEASLERPFSVDILVLELAVCKYCGLPLHRDNLLCRVMCRQTERVRLSAKDVSKSLLKGDP